MDWTKRRDAFRAILEGKRCVHPGSVADPISARIAEDLGFECGIFAGSVASLAVLGAPDIMLLTLTEFAGQAYRVNRAGNLPVIVDADHGYGNALNVRRAVEELETAGVAAMTIEDTLLPAAYGAGDKAQLLSIEEGAGKLRAALDARRDPRLCIVGRTAAISISGLDDAIARGRAYQALGVDAMFFTGIKTRAEMEKIAAAITIPICVGGGSADLMDLDYLSPLGARICLQGHPPYMAAIQATYATLKALREGTAPSRLTGLAPNDLLKKVTRDADWQRWSKEFLGG